MNTHFNSELIPLNQLGLGNMEIRFRPGGVRFELGNEDLEPEGAVWKTKRALKRHIVFCSNTVTIGAKHRIE